MARHGSTKRGLENLLAVGSQIKHARQRQWEPGQGQRTMREIAAELAESGVARIEGDG